MWIRILGWPVEPVEPLAPVEIGKISDLFFYGQTGIRAIGLNLNHVSILRRCATPP
jgi:hypothetical protein